MSQHIERKFRNIATTPIFVGVAACVDDEGIVRDLHATGGTVNIEPAAAAEAQRMRDWLRDTFVGQHYFFFNAHNGVVPHARVAARDLKPEVRIVNTISPINLDDVDTKTIAERIMRKMVEPKYRPARADMHFALAPALGTYWQDRNRPARFFVVTQKNEHGDHTHVRLTRVDNMRGGQYDVPFTTPTAWDKEFKQVYGKDVPGNPYAATASVVFVEPTGVTCVSFGGNPPISAADLTDEQINRLTDEHSAQHPGVREFLQDERERQLEKRNSRKVGMPPELGMPFGKKLADFPSLDEFLKDPERRFFVMPRNAGKTSDNYIEAVFRDFIGGVPFEGEEQPPAVGERYHSMISDQTYTVIDVRRKLHSTDHYVTMERDNDGHRTKFTYRDHATWLSVWRPLDPDGKKHVKVEIAVDASNALRQVGEAAHRAAEAMVDYRETDAERQLRILYRELDRRVPGWRDSETPGVFVDELGLALRGIRTLNRMHGRKENDDLREQNKTLTATLEARTKEVDALKHERGGSWGPERIRTEQDRMREMIYEYARLFRIIHGTERLKTHMQAFGVTTMRELPQEVYVNFMRDCRAFAEKCMP